MKPVMALKPLVFAIAALMAVAAQAGGGGNGNGGGNNNNNDQLLTQLQLSAGAAAMVQDGQTSANNKALNQGTHNLANVNGSINNSSGNMAPTSRQAMATSRIMRRRWQLLIKASFLAVQWPRRRLIRATMATPLETTPR